MVSFTNAQKTGYCLVTCKESQDDVFPTRVKKLDVFQTSSMNIPNLALSNGGPIAFITFPEKLIVVSLGSPFEQCVPFRTNAILGIGVDKSKLFSKEHEQQSMAIVCTPNPSAGVLQIDVAIGQSSTFGLELELEQAVFFNCDDNPLLFTLHHGDLNRACLQLSKSIRSSENLHLRHALDLTTCLAEKRERLQLLIQIVKDNGMLEQVIFDLQKLDAKSLALLEKDTQQIAGFEALWLYQNTLFAYFNLTQPRKNPWPFRYACQ